MKHLIIYENFQDKTNNPINAKYTIGRYVYLKDSVKKSSDIDWNFPYAKLLNATIYKYFTPDYTVEFFNKNNRYQITNGIDEEDILRYLSDEEIDEYKLQSLTNKYNL